MSFLYQKALILSFFDYKKNFINSKHKNRNSKGTQKPCFKRSFKRIPVHKLIMTRFGMTISINAHLRLHSQHEFLTLNK